MTVGIFGPLVHTKRVTQDAKNHSCNSAARVQTESTPMEDSQQSGLKRWNIVHTWVYAYNVKITVPCKIVGKYKEDGGGQLAVAIS